MVYSYCFFYSLFNDHTNKTKLSKMIFSLLGWWLDEKVKIYGDNKKTKKKEKLSVVVSALLIIADVTLDLWGYYALLQKYEIINF
jgi:hypothetical protein